MSHSPSDWIPPEFEEKRDQILECAAEHGSLNVRLLGPVGFRTLPVDKNLFLVRLGPGRLVYDLNALALRLQSLLDRPLDVLCEAQLPEPLLRDARRRAVLIT